LKDTNSILVTGATGILGSRIVKELLERTDYKVYCLARAGSEQEGFARLRSAIGVYGEDRLDELMGDRVIAVPGDTQQPGLGIDPARFHVPDLDCVIHSAASVNLIALYHTLRKPNVVATENVAQFCATLQVPMVHVSTHGVFGTKAFEKGSVFKETDLDVGQEFRFFYYAKSKYDAEKIVRRYSEEGLPTIIVRPGDIFGDSQSGAYPLRARPDADVFYDILKTAIDLGLASFKDDHFDLTPVDFVAQAIVALMQDPDCYGKTFHLTNPDRKKYYQIVNYLIEYGYRIRFIQFQEYLDLIKKGMLRTEDRKYTSKFITLTEYFSSFFEGQSLCGTFDTTYTQSVLSHKGIQCPSANFDLIKTYLDYAIAEGFVSPPASQVLPSYDSRPTLNLRIPGISRLRKI
jgi:thioester reductase-like protein